MFFVCLLPSETTGSLYIGHTSAHHVRSAGRHRRKPYQRTRLDVYLLAAGKAKRKSLSTWKALMSFKKGDRVRAKDNQAFAVVKEIQASGSIYVNFAGKSGPYSVKEDEIVEDYVIPNGTWCFCPSRQKATFLVIGHRRATAPAPNESLHEYHFKLDEGPGLSDWINGALLQEFQTIARPKSAHDFFTKVNESSPLIHIPESMRSGDFHIAYRGDSRGPGEIFEQGFSPRRERVTPIFRTLKRGADNQIAGPQFDLDSKSGVCASHKPGAAGLFPLIDSAAPSLIDETWIYAFFAYQPFETFKIQQAAKDSGYEQYIEKLLQGEEIALGKEGVPPQTILVGFKVQRTWSSRDWTEGCRYSVLGFCQNAETYYREDPEYLNYRFQLEQKLWDELHMRRSPAFKDA